MAAAPRRALVGSIAAISLLAIAPAVAHAQSAEAEQRFSEAEALLAEGKTEEACQAFEESNGLEERAGTLINIGLCKEKLGKLASALAAYRSALERVKDPKKKAIATGRIAALERRVSRLTIAVPREARLEGLAVSRDGERVDADDYDRPVPIDGGSHEIEAHAPGHRRWSISIEAAPENDKAWVSVPRLSPSKRKQAASSAIGGAGSEAPEPLRVDARKPERTALKVVGAGLLSATGASLVYMLFVTNVGPIPNYENLGMRPRDENGQEVYADSASCGDGVLRNSARGLGNEAFDYACRIDQSRAIVGKVGFVSGMIAAGALYFAYRDSGKRWLGLGAGVAAGLLSILVLVNVEHFRSAESFDGLLRFTW